MCFSQEREGGGEGHLIVLILWPSFHSTNGNDFVTQVPDSDVIVSQL